MHEEWRAAGIGADGAGGTRLVPPTDTAYGMRELAVVDPSGNLLRVGSPIPAGPASATASPPGTGPGRT